jgi:hypothetical protein
MNSKVVHIDDAGGIVQSIKDAYGQGKIDKILVRYIGKDGEITTLLSNMKSIEAIGQIEDMKLDIYRRHNE